MIYLSMTLACVIFVLTERAKLWSLLLYLSFRNESETLRWTQLSYVVKSEPFLIKVFEETLWGTTQEGKGIAHFIQDLLTYFEFSR